MVFVKVKKSVTHQGIGGKEFKIDETVTFTNSDVIHKGIFGGNWACRNFLDRRPDLLDELNKLSDEIEQLKKGIGNLEHTKDFCAECCERLEKENEELKSEIRKVQRDYVQLWMHKYK